MNHPNPDANVPFGSNPRGGRGLLYGLGGLYLLWGAVLVWMAFTRSSV
jgi:hypothetical protein